MIEQIKALFTASPVAILDIAIVLFIFYRLFLIIRGTRAVQLLKGLAVLIIASLISMYAGLSITSWILNQTLTVGFIAVPIIFYPELRRALEHLGRGSIFLKSSLLAPGERAHAIDELIRAVTHLASGHLGALVVWEQETGLKDWSETGVDVDAVLTAELLINIFEPNTPLHDGAVILRGNRVRAASCYLPLSDNPDLKVGLGTRHRAAMGITEHSDAIAIVVSEETGAISLGYEGKLTRYLDDKSLRDWLEKNLHHRQHDLFRRNHVNGKE